MNSATLPNHVRFNYSGNLKTLFDLFKPNEQDKKFIQVLSVLLVLYLIVAVVVPFLTQKEIQREVKEQLPVHLAKIILKEKQLPPPKKVKEEPKKIDKVEKVEKPKEEALPKPIKQREVAKQKAQSSGLAAMKDDLFEMREAFEIKPESQVSLDKSKVEETKVKRKLIASQANKQANTLDNQSLNKTVVSDELSSRQTQQVRLSKEEVLAGTDVIVEANLAKTNANQRSEMTIRRTLEAHKARLYARYNRSLRKDPFLQGKVLFEIEIQPSGQISSVTIKSSELNNAKLERQLLVILRSIKFAKENVGVMTTIWAIDFLPS